MTDEQQSALDRIVCFVMGHNHVVSEDTVLEGRDYIEVTMKCKRCLCSKTEILEYNE